MNMTDIFTLMSQFRATHGWRFRYVKRVWWVWDGTQWSYLDALDRMQRALVGLARDEFPAKHKAPAQLEHAYMIRNMEMRLRLHLHAETLPGDPTPRDPESE